MPHARAGAPVLPCTPDPFLSPQQPTAGHGFDNCLPPPDGSLFTHMFVDRHSRAFAPGGRVRVAQYSHRYDLRNGVEGGISAPSAPAQPHQRNYAHAAIAVSSSLADLKMESSDSESPVRRGWQPPIRSYGGLHGLCGGLLTPLLGSTRGPDGYSECTFVRAAPVTELTVEPVCPPAPACQPRHRW